MSNDQIRVRFGTRFLPNNEAVFYEGYMVTDNQGMPLCFIVELVGPAFRPPYPKYVFANVGLIEEVVKLVGKQ